MLCIRKILGLPSRSAIVLPLPLSILIYLEVIFVSDTVEIAFHVPVQIYTGPGLVCLLHIDLLCVSRMMDFQMCCGLFLCFLLSQ